MRRIKSNARRWRAVPRRQAAPAPRRVHGQGGRWVLRCVADVREGDVILADEDCLDAIKTGDHEFIDWTYAADDATDVRAVQRQHGGRYLIEGQPRKGRSWRCWGFDYQELLRWES